MKISVFWKPTMSAKESENNPRSDHTWWLFDVYNLITQTMRVNTVDKPTNVIHKNYVNPQMSKIPIENQSTPAKANLWSCGLQEKILKTPASWKTTSRLEGHGSKERDSEAVASKEKACKAQASSETQVESKKASEEEKSKLFSKEMIWFLSMVLLWGSNWG